MNPHAAYQQHNVLGWARIDMLLSLYDGVIDRLEQAHAALERHDEPAAKSLLARAALLVAEMIAGLDLNRGELPEHLARLYEFVLHSVSRGAAPDVEAALGVMRVLREGFREIRPEAARLEQSGEIPALHGGAIFEATA